MGRHYSAKQYAAQAVIDANSASHFSNPNVPASGGGNQNIGYSPISITASMTTDGGIGEPTGTVFGSASPDLSGYFDANPFTTPSVYSMGNTPRTVNGSAAQGSIFFGANSNRNPSFNGNASTPDTTSRDASEQQIVMNSQEIIRYAIYGAVGIAVLWLGLKYLK